MLDGALPEMLARLLIVQPEDECVLLLLSILIVLDDDQSELLLLKVQLGDLWPQEQTNLLDALKYQDASGC